MIKKIRGWWDERRYGQPYRDMVTRRQAEIDAGTAGSLAIALMGSERGRRALFRAERTHAREQRRGRHRAGRQDTQDE